MKKKTKILFTFIISILSIAFIILLIWGIQHTSSYHEAILTILGLDSQYVIQSQLDNRIRLFVFHLSSVIVISLTLIFNIFLIIYFWKNEITFYPKEESQKRKEDKKKAKIQKMEKEIERLKDGK